MLNFSKKLLDSLVGFGRSYKMLDIGIFFCYFFILNLLMFVSFTTNNINKSIGNDIFDLIVIISDFLESFGLTDIINDYTCIWAFVVMRNNGSINLLSTSVIVIIPCFLTLFDVKVDIKCCHTCIIIKIVLISGEKCSFSSGSQT